MSVLMIYLFFTYIYLSSGYKKHFLCASMHKMKTKIFDPQILHFKMRKAMIAILTDSLIVINNKAIKNGQLNFVNADIFELHERT